jgi:hypothetical protein
MNAEDLVIYDNGECEEVEHVGKVVPDVGVTIFSTAFCVEAVGLRYTTRFVVASDKVYAVWVAQF